MACSRGVLDKHPFGLLDLSHLMGPHGQGLVSFDDALALLHLLVAALQVRPTRLHYLRRSSALTRLAFHIAIVRACALTELV